MDSVIKTNNQIFNENWYILDSREYILGEIILPIVKVGEENPEDNLSVWKIKEVPLYQHLKEHNSHVYEVSIEKEEDVVLAIDETEEDCTSKIGFSQYLNALHSPLTVDEIKILLTGASNSQKLAKNVPSLAYCLVKKVKVIREILSVFYVAVKNNHNVGDLVFLEDCFHRHPYSSLKGLKSALLKQEDFYGNVFIVYRGVFIDNAIDNKGIGAEIPLGEYITDTETLKKWDLSNEVQLFP